MHTVDFIVRKDLEPYINSIMVDARQEPDAHTNIPLYADGYPGIMFQQSANEFYLLPSGKTLSELFLYGQTIEPVSLDVRGPFRFVVFQLYPFASKYLLGVDPKLLNDECFDLLHLDHVDVAAIHRRLLKSEDLQEQVNIISELMLDLIASNRQPENDQIQRAIALILERKGQIKMQQVLERVYMSERSFERNFKAQVGLQPKQFARIVQFQSALHRLNRENFDDLVDVGFDSGFSDQSHFIRSFKRYTGQTPSDYLRQVSAR